MQAQTIPANMGGSPMPSAERHAETGDLAHESPQKDDSRMQLSQHDLLLFTVVSEEKSLARSATANLNPRVATTSDELSAHFETERFKLVVVECDPETSELVQSAISVHRRIPPEDGSSLIAFKAGPDSVLDLLRYTPSASAFAFLAAKPHQLRAHILEVLTP
ncbi:MAG: hypothetical protein HWE33_17105 [Rhodobacteraceae bacterium]|nr:hypothetical protein [Paracoccaceae bacterium]